MESLLTTVIVRSATLLPNATQLSIAFYVRNGTVYLPVMARTHAGYYVDMEPVEVVSANDAQAFATVLQRAIERGNPVVPAPARDAVPKPVVLRYAKVKSWKQFEHTADYWHLSRDDDAWEFGPWKRRLDRGWEPDATRQKHLEGQRNTEDVVKSLVQSVQQHK